MLGRSPGDVVPTKDWPAVASWLNAALSGLGHGDAVFRVRRGDDTLLWVEARCRAVEGDGGLLIVMRDVSERRAAEERATALTGELARLAHCDGLTGLANRRRLDEVLASECARASRDGTPVSLLLLDVDRFKAFNDLYGHQEDDACLRKVSDAVRAAVTLTDALVARYGGEELAVVLPGLDACSAAVVAEMVRQAVEGLGLPHANGAAGVVTASIGCATGGRPEDLVAVADARLYEAKRGGRNRVIAADATPEIQSGPDEEARLAALARYNRSGCLSRSDSLDRLARMTAHALGMPVAFVSLVGRDTVKLVGRHGTDVEAAARAEVFCGRTILDDGPLVVPDARSDARFADLPMVRDGVLFYAGAPIVDDHGHRLGALCVVDFVPRSDVDRLRRGTLVGLADLVSHDLRDRIAGTVPPTRRATDLEVA